MDRVEVDFRNGLLVTRLSGDIAYPQVAQWIRDVESLEHEHPEGVDRFHDLRAMGRIELDFDRIFSASRRRNESHIGDRKVKSAFLVTDELGYGLVRIYQATVDDEKIEVQVFYKLSEAAEWLGVPGSSLEWS